MTDKHTSAAPCQTLRTVEKASRAESYATRAAVRLTQGRMLAAWAISLLACSTATATQPQPDAATSSDASVSDNVRDAASVDTRPICQSGQFWTEANGNSDRMAPGTACISCHIGADAAPLTIAGTVYPSLQEWDNCYGSFADGGITVVITDNSGRQILLPVNDVGNFSTNTPVSFPLVTKIVRGGSAMSMGTPTTSGDCNSCHTKDGARDAPGRILQP